MRKDGERPLKPEEREFFHGLYQSHYQALFGYTYQLGVGKEVAEDYVQDTFTAAIRHIEDIRQCENPRGYLYQILKNVIGYQLRSMRYALNLLKQLQEEQLIAQGEAYTDELRPETLYGGAVSDEELKLLIRFYLEGWPQKELADALGVSENACQKRIARAKKHLRRALEEAGPREPEQPLGHNGGKEGSGDEG